eukprot:12906438-Prorocentrum_lima.AAC.1
MPQRSVGQHSGRRRRPLPMPRLRRAVPAVANKEPLCQGQQGAGGPARPRRQAACVESVGAHEIILEYDC